MKVRGVILPEDNRREAAVVEGVEVMAVATLGQAVAFLNGQLPLEPYQLDGEPYATSAVASPLDFADVKGQEAGEAGDHDHRLQWQSQHSFGGAAGDGQEHAGPADAGNLAAADAAGIAGNDADLFGVGVVAGRHRPDGPAAGPHAAPLGHRPGVGRRRVDPAPRRGVAGPPRHPVPGRAAGVPAVRAGDAAAAAGGRRRDRGPGEREREVPGPVHARGGDEPLGQRVRRRQPRARDKYLAKLSGPLLDRIDIHVEVPAVPYSELVNRRAGTDSATMRESVARARSVQQKRFGDGTTNARMDSRGLRQHCDLSEGCLLMMKQAMDELGLSARAFDKVRRVARTLADLAGAEHIGEDHVAEAVQYRLLDRKF